MIHHFLDAHSELANPGSSGGGGGGGDSSNRHKKKQKGGKKGKKSAKELDDYDGDSETGAKYPRSNLARTAWTVTNMDLVLRAGKHCRRGWRATVLRSQHPQHAGGGRERPDVDLGGCPDRCRPDGGARRHDSLG